MKMTLILRNMISITLFPDNSSLGTHFDVHGDRNTETDFRECDLIIKSL